jgi:hypothetical protein
MGNNESATTCAVGVGSGAVLGFGCAAFLAVPPLAAICFGTVGVGGALAAANSAEACEMAVNGQKRKKRQSSGRFGYKGQQQQGRGRGDQFDTFDVNRDGYLSPSDVPPNVADPMKPIMMSFMTMLPFMDVDQDGRISRAEAQTFRDTIQTEQGQMQWLYSMMDRNKDNRLTPEEMVQVTGMCSLANQNNEAWDGYKQSMKVLGCEQKGYADFQDVWNWYSRQPKRPGQDTVWGFQIRNQTPRPTYGWTTPPRQQQPQQPQPQRPLYRGPSGNNWTPAATRLNKFY